MNRHLLVLVFRVLAAGVFLFVPVGMPAQQESSVAAAAEAGGEGVTMVAGESVFEGEGEDGLPDGIPPPVTSDNFAELTEHSPFLRSLNLSSQLILTGIARIEEETYATVLDLETGESQLVSEKTNAKGWQLMEVKGDPSDVKTLTARIRMAGAEVVPIRYQEAPPTTVIGLRGVTVSTLVGNGSRGGGTGPHGGPDPRVLTPDQMADARNGARNIRDGFQADGYGDRETIPAEVVSKISRLSVDQRESINVKMFEHRNRGLGMQERKQIYNGLLDRAARGR